MKVMKLFSGAMTMAALAVATVVSAAPLNYNGGAYTQNFDGLPTDPSTTVTTVGKGPHAFSVLDGLVTPNPSGMEGWYFANSDAGSSTDTEFRAQDGSLAGSGGRGAISFGTTGSTERALGALPTSNNVNSFGLHLINNTSDTFASIDISFVGEQWRFGDRTVPNTLAFSYGVNQLVDTIQSGTGLTSVSQLDFSSPIFNDPTTDTALDGNLPANQTAKSHTIGGLNWQPGQSLILRWVIDQESGQDAGLAIDNLSLTANAAPIPEPSGLVIAGLGLMGLLGFRRRRRA